MAEPRSTDPATGSYPDARPAQVPLGPGLLDGGTEVGGGVVGHRTQGDEVGSLLHADRLR